MSDFKMLEKRLLKLPPQNLRSPDFAQINFKIQVAKLQQKSRRQTLALAAAFVLSTAAILVSIQLAVKTAPAAVMTGAKPVTVAAVTAAPVVNHQAKSGENLESSDFEISWGKSDEVKNLAQAVNNAQWQIATFNPITVQE